MHALERAVYFFVGKKVLEDQKSEMNSEGLWTVFHLSLHPKLLAACHSSQEAAYRGGKGGAQLPGCVAFGGLLTLSEPLFPHL